MTHENDVKVKFSVTGGALRKPTVLQACVWRLLAQAGRTQQLTLTGCPLSAALTENRSAEVILKVRTEN